MATTWVTACELSYGAAKSCAPEKNQTLVSELLATLRIVGLDHPAAQVFGRVKSVLEFCESDLRCLDAHAHLGNLVFDHGPKEAIRHYEVGLRVGELSLGDGFDGLLPWGLIDNRPFLRCMHGFGLCLWRLGRQPEARHIFDRMLWLNPTDSQGVRFLIADIQNGRTWEECQDA